MSEPVNDYFVCEMMQRYGGSFVRLLGQLATKADPGNLARLKAAFPEYWEEYATMYLLVRARAQREHEAEVSEP